MLLLEAEHWGSCKTWIYFAPYSCTAYPYAYAYPISLTEDIQSSFF